MVLILAEKPSLARNIAAAIGATQKKSGYIEGNGYLVSWAFGHLFSLCDIEAYTGQEKGTRWSMATLPCIPDTFRFELRREGKSDKPDAGIVRQFEVISTLCNRPDVDTILNAGDADREGEIIIRLCIQNALKTQKDCRRLWLPDQTPQTIRRAITECKPLSDYDNLANEGFARTYIDWLYGVNLTRYATLRTGKLLRVGRVIAPIVRAIYERDRAIEQFVPSIYYTPYSEAQTNGQVVELQSKQKFEENELQKAQALCDKYNAAGAWVTDKKGKTETVAPGKLYSLSKLQNFLGKKYKMSMEESLRILQKLYEEGYVTYPRTNSEYLATAEKDKMKKILSQIASLGYPVAFRDGKTIFDDAKIESHSALTPTYKIPRPDSLSPDERTVYQSVFRRFVAVFCAEPCKVNRTELTVCVGSEQTGGVLEEFHLKGTVMVQQGWTKYDEYAQKDKQLPPLAVGDRVEISFAPKEKETTPPKHYTIETLNNYLKNPFRQEKAKAQENEDDTEEYRAMFEGLELGTEATRTSIIENACQSEYIARKKDVYTILPGGVFFIESLDRMGIQMDKYKTSTLGQALKKVYRGTITVAESVAMARAEIESVFAPVESTPETDTDMGFYGEEVGVCPLCGKTVKRGTYNYGCTGYRDGCTFRVGLVICSRALSIANMRRLLRENTTAKISGFLSKAGKPFDASLSLENGQIKFHF